jgi:hypothetical protein
MLPRSVVQVGLRVLQHRFASHHRPVHAIPDVDPKELEVGPDFGDCKQEPGGEPRREASGMGRVFLVLPFLPPEALFGLH